MTNTHLDPYTAKAENNDLSPQEKITGLQEVLESVKTAMLTTRAADGQLHSRAMMPSHLHSETQLNLIFLANNASHKFEEIENDANVNVSFCDLSTTSWASFSGKARVSQDRSLIKKHWSTFVSAYFGNLHDGIHTGDEYDPRVSIIEVVPDEIRYWVATQGRIGRAINTAYSAATGGTVAPGELRTITESEIKLVHGFHSKDL